MLAETANCDPSHAVEGATVRAALDDLFSGVPVLHHHVLDETGSIRPHVSVFVDGHQADLETSVADGSDIRILHAVSGG